ncbi:MAG: glycosyltransferase [Isosphaeraceae bacterium]|nr:glycosyltransferase [Isosphaeraceae bacterium]
MRNPTYAFYAETCFYRTEHFLHDQLRGIAGAEVRAIARWGACLDEFPVPALFLAEEFRTPLLRVWNALLRRISRDRPTPGRLPPYAIRRIARHLRRHPVDLIYCIFGWNAAQLLDVLDRLERPVPLVFLAGGSDITAAPSFGEDYPRRLGQACDRATLILCGSRFLAGKLRARGVPEGKLAVHYIGIELPAPDSNRSGREGRGFRALAVSRLAPVKGVLHTIRAFARVAGAIPDATLEVIGDGEQRPACAELIEELGLAGRVQLRGSLPLARVYEAMQRSHVFLQHNVRTPEGQEESLGGAILEASAHRLPVIVTRSGGVPEAVEDGRTGVIVEPGDEEAMATALLELARDPGRRERLGTAGRALVERIFDLREQNRRLGQILHRVYEESLR